MAMLRRAGYTVARSAGSHGLWDIAAVARDGTPFYFQVWYTRTKARVYWVTKDENLDKFRAMRVRGEKWLLVYRYGNSTPEWHLC